MKSAAIDKLFSYFLANHITLATAESCTGGMLAAAITALPGASAFFHGGVVSYSNQVKRRLLHVSAETLAGHGAVSVETALEMAAGVRRATGADFAVSITGIAGPDGGTRAKPVGTVCIGVSRRGFVQAWCHHFPGGRDAVRKASCLAAAAHVLELARRR